MKAMDEEDVVKHSPLQFPIGNCKVTIKGSSYSCGGTGRQLEIKIANAATIKVTVDEASCPPLNNFAFVLVNPKDSDSKSEHLLQEALRLYGEELPAMNYAANTGKESAFLERCVSSGKYCNLLWGLSVGGVITEVLAAVTYQIVPTDTHYAEIPLAAVSSNYQHKGIGSLLYSELRRRLQNVGIRTIYCWGDKESEGFWIKQGFEIIAEVNAKGKVRRLPIKADIRKALCFPGGSTLMVSHLNQKEIFTPSPCVPLESLLPKMNELVPKESIPQIENNRSQLLVGDGCSTDDEEYNGSSPVRDLAYKCTEVAPSNAMGCNTGSTGLRGTKYLNDADRNHCSCSTQSLKRQSWETSLSSIKSKKVKGGYHIDCSSRDLNYGHEDGNNSCFKICPLNIPKLNHPMDAVSTDSLKHNICKDQSFVEVASKAGLKENYHTLLGDVAKEDDIQERFQPNTGSRRIMLMDIADEAKKTFLKKIIEDLGGAIAPDGSASTHIITGKARKTLNFCVALCSGAWVISTNWLKESFREGRFLDELPFILQDEEYTSKYKSELKNTVLRAKAHPGALLKDYDICLAKHVQPPVDILSEIIKSAGGNVLCALNKVREPSRTIFVACEEDMEEAMLAAKRGIWAFSSDWFMSCIMRQELDMQAPQFAESL